MLHAEMRPYSFDGVKGQDKVIKILQNDVLKDNIKGAYCFTGVRGTGKTTSARLMAMAINCKHPKEDGSPCLECETCKSILTGTSLDVLELDAASNNSVDNVRDILQKVQYKPMAKKKVFILDECHMLSNAASNALLKVLEEPPKDVVFILCTTERHKVLPTIMSRCSCFTFERIDTEVIKNRLQEVCELKGVEAEPAALSLIAKAADGAMRDGLSILDKFISTGSVTADEVADVLGLTPSAITFEILNGIAKREPVAAVDAIRSLNGASVQCAVEDMYSTLLDVIDFQSSGCKESIIGSSDYVKQIINLSYELNTERAFSTLSALKPVFAASRNERLFVTTVLSVIYEESKVAELEARVSHLEKEIEQIKTSGIIITDEPACPGEIAEMSALSVKDTDDAEKISPEAEDAQNEFVEEKVGEQINEISPEDMVPAASEQNGASIDTQNPTEENIPDGFVGLDLEDGISFDDMLTQLANDTADTSRNVPDTNSVSSQPEEQDANTDSNDDNEAFAGPEFGFGDDLARLFGN